MMVTEKCELQHIMDDAYTRHHEMAWMIKMMGRVTMAMKRMRMKMKKRMIAAAAVVLLLLSVSSHP